MSVTEQYTLTHEGEGTFRPKRGVRARLTLTVAGNLAAAEALSSAPGLFEVAA